MRRFVWLSLVCSFVLLVSFAQAQQFDVAAGGSTTWTTEPTTASQTFLPPALKGGLYPSLSLQYLLPNHFGINAEGAVRYNEALYNNYQFFRPVFYDVNGVYTRKLTAKARGDLMAGVGGETLIFYENIQCGNPTGCGSYTNSTHFVLHFAADVRYYAWRKLFVRPEFHYSYIPDNFQFHSNHVFRYGASIGYSFGPRRNPSNQAQPTKK